MIGKVEFEIKDMHLNSKRNNKTVKQYKIQTHAFKF